MKYSPLGSSKLSVSDVGFGCMSLEVGNSGNEHLLRSAADAGINYFDTADLYDRGLNEEIVGKALKPVRDQIIIATKVGNQWRDDGSGWDWNPRKEYILKAVEDSLRRLQTDIIDLYQLHGGTIDDPIDETIEAFELLREQGKIREYGISSIRPNVIREWVKRSNLTSVMMQYSLLDRRPEEHMLDYLHQNNVSVVTRGSLAKGMLINKPAKEYLGYSVDQLKELQNAVQEADNPLSTALDYVHQHPAVTSAVVGIRTESQLQGVLNSTNTTTLNHKLEELAEVLPPNFYEQHR